MDEYKTRLLSLNDQIEQDALDRMKFYCDSEIGAGVLENVKKPIHLFSALERRNLLGPNNPDFLANLFEKIGRRDLKNRLLGIEEPVVVQTSRVPDAPTVVGRLSEANLYDISEDLGRDWKQLGRKLGFSSNVLDNINEDNRRVREKAFQLLLQWKRKNGNAATAQVLADNLTLIGRKDIAERLAEICQRDDRTTADPLIQVQAVPVQAQTQNKQQEGPLETVGQDLRQNIPKQEMANPKNDEADSPGTNAVLTHGPSQMPSADTTEATPVQEVKAPTLSHLAGILDPNRYFVLKQIGSGSCGKVYLCETKDRKHKYAVKQVELGMNNEETKKQVKLLKKEIDILKRLRNDYIVALYHSEDTAHTISIFMEYLPGGSISEYVSRNGAMEEPRVRKYTYQILKGCEYLHEKNVIHRDIKGANVMIDARKNIRLADFGIAKDLQSVLISTGSTTSGSFCGTIYWCSPEHFNTKERPTYVFDIWSVGCTVVEMLTKKPPNFHLDFVQAMNEIVSLRVHPPEHLSPLAKGFIEMCFRKKEERPTATELLNREFPAENAPDKEDK